MKLAPSKPLPFNKTLARTLLLLSLLAAPPAWAGYAPVDSSAPSGPTINTGRRGGCGGDASADLATLAPKSHVGQTVSSHPTLVWYVPDADPMSLEFFLYDITEPRQRQLIYKSEMVSTPGIMSTSLPSEQSGLEAGRRYFWQVVLLCNPNRPSSALVASAELEVVAPSMDLGGQINQISGIESTDPNAFYQRRSALYAEAGIWYDAIADSLHPALAGDRTTTVELLTNLSEYEASRNSPIELLQSVIEAIRAQF